MKYMLMLLLCLTTLMLTAQNLSEHRWQNRLLLVMDYTANTSQLATQLTLLNQNHSGLKERKLLVYQVTNQGIYQGLDAPKKWDTNSLILPENVKKTAKKSLFSIYLIGLDGGIKMKKDSIVSLATIFSLIDGMPMRRAELKN